MQIFNLNPRDDTARTGWKNIYEYLIEIVRATSKRFAFESIRRMHARHQNRENMHKTNVVYFIALFGALAIASRDSNHKSIRRTMAARHLFGECVLKLKKNSTNPILLLLCACVALAADFAQIAIRFCLLQFAFDMRAPNIIALPIVILLNDVLCVLVVAERWIPSTNEFSFRIFIQSTYSILFPYGCI